MERKNVCPEPSKGFKEIIAGVYLWPKKIFREIAKGCFIMKRSTRYLLRYVMFGLVNFSTHYLYIQQNCTISCLKTISCILIEHFSCRQVWQNSCSVFGTCVAEACVTGKLLWKAAEKTTHTNLNLKCTFFSDCINHVLKHTTILVYLERKIQRTTTERIWK